MDVPTQLDPLWMGCKSLFLGQAQSQPAGPEPGLQRSTDQHLSMPFGIQEHIDQDPKGDNINSTFSGAFRLISVERQPALPQSKLFLKRWENSNTLCDTGWRISTFQRYNNSNNNYHHCHHRCRWAPSSCKNSSNVLDPRQRKPFRCAAILNYFTWAAHVTLP